MTKILIQKEYFTVNECIKNPKSLYIFGDNAVNYGKGGQAIIRDCPNAFGIPTKMFPTMTIEAFFMDTPESFKYVLTKVEELNDIFKSNKYDYIVFPIDGLGTGLARMPYYAPKLFKQLCDDLYKLFGIEMTEKGFINEN